MPSHSRFRSRAGMSMLSVICALLLSVAAAGAQDLSYLSHQAWSTEEGLPQSSVHSIVQTSDGYLWIATEQGLARFDGLGFMTFSRATNRSFVSDDISCLAEDGSGGLWIGTGDGLLRMQKDKFRRYGIADGLRSSKILSIATQGGQLLVDTAGGLAQWNDPGFRALPETHPEQPTTVAAENGNRYRWSFDGSHVSITAPGVEHIWEVGRELPAGRMQTLYLDREGVAWIGMNSGLFALKADAHPIRIDSLGRNSVLSIFEDAEGNHWIGTETSGLHVLRQLKFRSVAPLANDAVTAVAQTLDGSMWVGTRDDGLRRVQSGVVDQPVPAHDLTSPVILCLAPSARGGLWVGTPDGLNFVDDRNSVTRITSADGLPDDFIRSLAASPDGSVWAGTQHGLVHLDHSKISVLTTADGLGGDTVGTLLFTSANELWAATSGGLSRFRSNGKITNFTRRDGLGGEIATAMAQDNSDGLWVATRGGGLSFFDGQRFVATNAFATNASIDSIRIDPAGLMWLRMDRGVSRVSLSALHACIANGRCADGATTHYGLADGLPNDEVVAGGSPMVWLTTRGELWFATRGGLAIADAAHSVRKDAAPPVVLQRFLVDDVSEDIGSKSIEIPYGHARFTIEYAGLDYTAPSEVRYRFLLEGFDKSLIDAGARRSASYTNLPPGEYLFRVEASKDGGTWSAKAATIRFRIIPPFYRRWWFVALIATLLLAILVALYLLRLRVVRRQFDAVLAERNRMAREIHDTLTQDFVGTSLQLDLIAQQLRRGKVDIAIDQVQRTRQLVTEGLEEARQSIWELRANNSQDSLPTRLATLLEREAFVSVAPKLHVGGAYRALDSRIEREILRIAQEALSNVVRHAQATQASVELHYSSDTLMLMIEDDGVGFAVDAASRKSGHYGILGMQERASSIDGTLEIASEPEQGSKVTLRTPVVAQRGDR